MVYAIIDPQCASIISPACTKFVEQAQQAITMLHEFEDLIAVGRVDAACALISEPANVKLRVVKSKKTDFSFLFDKVLDVIEANNELKAEEEQATEPWASGPGKMSRRPRRAAAKARRRRSRLPPLLHLLLLLRLARDVHVGMNRSTPD
jgi:hypothetical protein